MREYKGSNPVCGEVFFLLAFSSSSFILYLFLSPPTVHKISLTMLVGMLFSVFLDLSLGKQKRGITEILAASSVR